MAGIMDFLRAGLLVEGELLIWSKTNSPQPYLANIRGDGKITTIDGQVHASPSSAARHVNNGISTNGWRVWVVARTQESLSEIRAHSNLGNENGKVKS